MNKEALLQELAAKIKTGEISREEVTSRLNFGSSVRPMTDEKPKRFSNFSVTKMLYVLGAVVVLIGIVVFVSQVWEEIGSAGRILVTLGLGLIIAATGTVLIKQKTGENIGAIFHAIGGLLIPGGALVTLAELDLNQDTMWPTALTFGAIFVFYLLLNALQKNLVLTFFSIANGTAFVYLLAVSITQSGGLYVNDLFVYLTIIVGVSYLLLGQAFQNGWNKALTGMLNFFGALGIMVAAFTKIFGSVPWQLFYILLVMGGLFLSVYMKSRAILFVSTAALIAYVSYITGKYFADSIGWPISLVILGFVFIGLGYASVRINRKYIKGGN